MNNSMLENHVAEAVREAGCKGFVLLYLDGDRVRASGDLSLSALAPVVGPLLMKVLSEKLGGKS